MKLFKVTVEYEFVLVAENESNAAIKAYSYAKDALSDCTDDTVDISVEEYKEGSVCGWTHTLEPYAGDGKTTGEYLLGVV